MIDDDPKEDYEDYHHKNGQADEENEAQETEVGDEY